MASRDAREAHSVAGTMTGLKHCLSRCAGECQQVGQDSGTGGRLEWSNEAAVGGHLHSQLLSERV